MVNSRFETLKNQFYKNVEQVERLPAKSREYQEIVSKNREIIAELYQIVSR
ncbi:MAG: hypothetical protein K8E24_012860 [Methanobacterium paludis]|nr:hypothetical protein [Methanobacterium paludis]